MDTKGKDEKTAPLKQLPKLEYIINQPLHHVNSASSSNSGSYLEPPSNLMIQKEQFKQFSDEIDENKAKTLQKVKTLTKQNPFVPIGVLVTVGILGNGLFAMKNKDKHKSQRMMRYRVAAQGFTVIALVIGTMATQYFYKTDSNE